MKNLLYFHGGSGNRGCEAIVRSTVQILKRNGMTNISVMSGAVEEDYSVGLDEIAEILPSHRRNVEDLPILVRAIAKAYNKCFDTEYLYYKFTAGDIQKIDLNDTIAFSVGGDHYCYPGGEQNLAFHNIEVKKKGGKSILWGCSVEPSLLKPKVVEDMQRYDAIFARESITFNALKSCGVVNVYLHPDPAFTLDYEETEFSKNMSRNAVGINISTYAVGKNGSNNLGMKNYVELIRWIQRETDMEIYLIPHVFKSHTNDLETNQRILEALDNNMRIIPITEKYTAMQLKGIIRNCRFFIGARTHSTIAAYSSCVPTLVVGYSVKAKGISKDIFGDVNNYVVSVQGLSATTQLKDAFIWQIKHEDEIRKHLEDFMPGYIASAWEAGKKLERIAL